MSLYLDHYLDSLENLPVELQRNFTLMHDLDTRAQTVMKKIDAMADEYMKHAKSLSSDKKKEIMSDIKQLYNKAKEYGDDKVQLSIQTYELVDKHIRRLDSDLARFEAEIHDKANIVSRAKDEVICKTSREKFKEKEKKKGIILSEDEGGAKKKKKKTSGKTGGGKITGAKATIVISPSASPIAGLPLATGEVLDMPVDPNEPTYCLCHQVSYGEMIGCDNPDCPIEWFHFACVKLTTKPKGKWFCPKCSSERKKK